MFSNGAALGEGDHSKLQSEVSLQHAARPGSARTILLHSIFNHKPILNFVAIERSGS